MDNPSHSLICFKMVINHQPVFVFNSGDLGTRFFLDFFQAGPGTFLGGAAMLPGGAWQGRDAGCGCDPPWLVDD